MVLKELEKSEYKGYKLDFKYNTPSYFDLVINESSNEFSAKFIKKDFDKTIYKQFEEELFQDYWPNARAFAFFDNDKPIAFIEVEKEEWARRLRITNILILEEFRRNGLGSKLIDKAKEIAKESNCRLIILETQTCNTKAIDFYRSQGFEFIGFDKSCYNNDDIDRKEVRLEMGYYLIDVKSCTNKAN